MDVDLVILAMGFVHPVHEGMIEELGLILDKRGNVLVVRAIYQGNQAAGGIDKFLMGETNLT